MISNSLAFLLIKDYQGVNCSCMYAKHARAYVFTKFLPHRNMWGHLGTWRRAQNDCQKKFMLAKPLVRMMVYRHQRLHMKCVCVQALLAVSVFSSLPSLLLLVCGGCLLVFVCVCVRVTSSFFRCLLLACLRSHKYCNFLLTVRCSCFASVGRDCGIELFLSSLTFWLFICSGFFCKRMSVCVYVYVYVFLWGPVRLLANKLLELRVDSNIPHHRSLEALELAQPQCRNTVNTVVQHCHKQNKQILTAQCTDPSWSHLRASLHNAVWI